MAYLYQYIPRVTPAYVKCDGCYALTPVDALTLEAEDAIVLCPACDALYAVMPPECQTCGFRPCACGDEAYALTH